MGNSSTKSQQRAKEVLIYKPGRGLLTEPNKGLKGGMKDLKPTTQPSAGHHSSSGGGILKQPPPPPHPPAIASSSSSGIPSSVIDKQQHCKCDDDQQPLPTPPQAQQQRRPRGDSFNKGHVDVPGDDGGDTTGDFDADYILSRKLGVGAFGQVFMCIHRRTKLRCAAKVVDASKLNQDDRRHMEDEIDILKSLHHAHIVRLHHVYRTPHTVYIVQELCAGGELFDRIIEKKHYSENDARGCAERILKAVSYAHSQGIVHRDLKPENILLHSPDDDIHIKLADFGLAHRILGYEPLQTICGSPGYMAPEILKETPYNEKSDVWAVGTIMYCLLGGFNPFEGRSTVITIGRIKAGKYSFPSPYFDEVSEEAKDLIRCMLVVNPEKRLCARACLEHKWFKMCKSRLSSVDLAETKEKMREFKAKQTFKAAADAVLVMNRLKKLSTGSFFSKGIIRQNSISSSTTTASLDSSGHSSNTGPILETALTRSMSNGQNVLEKSGSLLNAQEDEESKFKKNVSDPAVNIIKKVYTLAEEEAKGGLMVSDTIALGEGVTFDDE